MPYQVNTELQAAIRNAAVILGSYRQLALKCGIPGIRLSLITDNHIKELDASTLKALLPEISPCLHPAEKKKVLEFILKANSNIKELHNA